MDLDISFSLKKQQQKVEFFQPDITTLQTIPEVEYAEHSIGAIILLFSSLNDCSILTIFHLFRKHLCACHATILSFVFFDSCIC